MTVMPAKRGNAVPTERSVRAKLERPGALFASDEVRVLAVEIDRLRRQVEEYRAQNRELVEKYVGTGRA